MPRELLHVDCNCVHQCARHKFLVDLDFSRGGTAEVSAVLTSIKDAVVTSKVDIVSVDDTELVSLEIWVMLSKFKVCKDAAGRPDRQDAS